MIDEDTAEAGDGREGPIFIVGPSRSGTSLLRVSLSNHARVWITRETHYFDDLRVRLGGGEGTLAPDQRALCEGYFLRLGHRAYGAEADTARSTVDRTDLRRFAGELGDDADAYFEAFCRLRARANGKTIWGEKTPRHVFRIDELFGFAPDAKVICLARDPRAVVASYRDWHESGRIGDGGERAFTGDRERARRSFHIGVASLLWRGAMRASQRARARHGGERVHLLRYEELVREPRRTLEDLCEWLGLDFQEAMLDVPIVQSSYATEASGISQEPLERWRSRLSAGEIATIESFVGGEMDDFEYARQRARGTFWAVAWGWLTLPFAFARAGFANRKRLGKASAYMWKRIRLVLP